MGQKFFKKKTTTEKYCCVIERISILLYVVIARVIAVCGSKLVKGNHHYIDTDMLASPDLAN